MSLKDQETNGAGVGDHEHRLWRRNCKYRLKNLRYFGQIFFCSSAVQSPKRAKILWFALIASCWSLGRVPICHRGLPLAQMRLETKRRRAPRDQGVDNGTHAPGFGACREPMLPSIPTTIIDYKQ